MVSAAEAEDRLDEHFTFVDAASDAGVEHLVYTSIYRCAPDSTFTLARDHYATEEHIKASGMEFTFLRNNLYLDFLPLMTGEDGVIRGPAGEGTFSGVAREDIAQCALAVLRDPAIHKGRTYNLTGPEELSMSGAAEVLTAGTGRTVSYHPETVEEAYSSRASYNAPQWQLDAWVSTYTAIAAGELAGVSPDVHGLTGQDPISLAEFLTRSQL
jgi:uncharacterized protein YbjT (DUF2867 family)